jgi:ATPase subunit of ABC transporter with duplicated ATPase domains
MPAPLLQLKDIALTFGGTPLLTSAELSVAAGERVCLVGRNGSGKSTLLRIAAGAVEPDAGSVFAQPGASLNTLSISSRVTIKELNAWAIERFHSTLCCERSSLTIGHSIKCAMTTIRSLRVSSSSSSSPSLRRC